MRFFFDRTTSPRIARMIQALEINHTVRHHDEFGGFTETTADVECIKALASDGGDWIVVSGDGRL